MDIPFHKSPNFRAGNIPKILIIHYTASGNMSGVIDTFMKPNGVSCHYIVGPTGEIVQMVKDENCAFHAGKSTYGNLDWLNNDSIGIELVNWGKLHKDSEGKIRNWTGAEHQGPYHYSCGDYWAHYPFVQMAACVKLTNFILDNNPEIKYITGHENVSTTRKFDPGNGYDWNNYLLECNI